MFVGVDFTVDLVTRTSRPSAIGTAALNHEIRNHTVERQTVIESLLRKIDKILDRIGSIGIKKLNVNRAFVGFNNRASHRYGPSEGLRLQLYRSSHPEHFLGCFWQLLLCLHQFF
jgi:hypothetical protein